MNTSHDVVATSAHEEKAKQFHWFSKVTYLPLDLNALEENKDYFDYFGKPNVMIHLAWEGLPNYKSSFHVDSILPQQYSFLANLVENGLNDLTVTGTCFEYGLKEGCLDESMESAPANAYAIAKDSLRKALEDLSTLHSLSFKWARLFYMYGKGQNQKSILAQLETAIQNKEEAFNMSGGEQLRDYLPVELVAEYIVKIALQKEVDGIINCCSGFPVSIKHLVTHYLQQRGATIKLNLGYYPYPDYEPMEFWGDTRKLTSIL